MTSSRSPKRISGPTELLQAIPYLLGFHPARSLVVVGLRGTALVVTARLDLAGCEPALLDDLVATVQRGGSTSLVAAIFADDRAEHRADDRAGGDRAGRIPAGGLSDGAAVAAEADAVRARLQFSAEAAGCDLSDLLLVSDGRWRSLLCPALGCCPPQGRALPAAVSAFAADATFRGVVALPDRAALERTLDPLPGRELLAPALDATERDALAAVLRGEAARRDRAATRALFAAARAADRPRAPQLEDAQVVRFGVALTALSVRDAVWLAVDDRRLDGRPLWRDLGRRLPVPYDAPALFLFGWAAWRAGDGALAAIAADRALAANPDYTAAQLLRSVLEQGLDPRAFPRLGSAGPHSRLTRSA